MKVLLIAVALLIPGLAFSQVDYGGCGGIPPKKPPVVAKHVPAPVSVPK